MEFVAEITFWHWFVAGVALVVLEMLAPGVMFLWLGIAAAATGLVALALPDMAWEGQVLVFAVLGVVSSIAGRVLVKHRQRETDHPTLNRRGEQYIGRRFTLAEPIENGFGKLRVDDTTWKVSGEDLPEGTPVEVTGVDGVILTVEKR